jgi:hypothetical protein
MTVCCIRSSYANSSCVWNTVREKKGRVMQWYSAEYCVSIYALHFSQYMTEIEYMLYLYLYLVHRENA